MIVQAVCLPEGSKMLVIPIFFPIIPFIVLQFMPAGLLGHAMVRDIRTGRQSPFATDLFP
jgi:hypothetical protein